MNKKIFRSIFLVSALVAFCALGIIMVVLFRYFGQEQKEQLIIQTHLAAKGLENEGLTYFDQMDLGDFRITWIDENGVVLYDNQADKETMENHKDREEVKEALATGYGEDQRYSTTMMTKTTYYAQLLEDHTILRLALVQSSIWAVLLNMMQPIGLLLLVSLILSVVLANYLSKRIVEPLNSLNLEEPLKNDTYEELSPVLNRIEHQQRQIKTQMQHLQQRKEEFHAITHGMEEALILLDHHESIVSINPAARELFQTDKSCMGQHILTIYRTTAFQEVLDKAKATGHSQTTASLHGREYQFNISRICREDKKIGLCLFIFDITEKAKSEELRKEFTANVTHELKTPLHSIMGFSELMENGLVKPEDLTEFSGKIRKEAARLVNLIDDILRLSQLDEKNNFTEENVDLFALMNEVTDSLSIEAGKKNIALEIKGTTAYLSGVRKLLYEIIYNLCDNAIKYSGTNSRVLLSLTQDETSLALSVKDEGIGIPKEHQSRIFERFYRVDKSHSRSTGGTGLGLSIVKHACEYHKATIELESQEGIGTTITVHFPILPRLTKQ